MATELLRLDDLSKFYTGKQSVVVGLNKINISFRRGEFVAVTGESGSGKSTLSHVLGGILPFESGELFFEGKPTSHFDSADWERYRRDRISFISQNYGILPGATVLGNVVSALRLTGMDKATASDAAKEILLQVELWDLRKRRAAKLSSGQKQRLSIARALAKPAPILIADEPTGNLDPENSAKVMALLAQAAKQRLVILVTHEFSEAEPYATRHVVLQDGRLLMDAPLRPAPEPEPMPQRKQAVKRFLSPYVALLQQRSRPVWTTLMVLFFAVTAFAAFAFAGTFIVSLDDTATRVYDNSAFYNGSPTRIVVSTPDGSPMTEEDYQRLVNVSHVVSLERNGYCTDILCGYRQDKDYSIRYETLMWDWFGNPMGSGHEKDLDNDGIVTYVTLYPTAPVLKTVPVLPDGQEFLTAGRLPENIFEAVAKTDASQIGRYATVQIADPDLNLDQVISITVKIVGVTDIGSGLYLHDDAGRLAQQCKNVQTTKNIYIYYPNEALDDVTFLSNSGLLGNFRTSSLYLQEDGSSCVSFRNINQEDPDAEDYFVKLSLVHRPELSYTAQRALQCSGQQSLYLVEVSPANFDLLTWNTPSEQVSLTIEDYAYTDRVLSAIEAMDYIAASPYRLGTTQRIDTKVEERSQTLKICAMALLAVMLLQVILLRAMFANQTGDYKLLSNIGLTCRNAIGSIWCQLGILVLSGQLLAALAIWLCARQGVERILNVLIYLPVPYVGLVWCIHTAVSVVGAAWVLIALKKQVYPLSGQDSDLELDETEVGP